MVDGIRIFNDAGKVVFDGTSRIPKILGSFETGLEGSLKVELSSPEAKLWVHAFSTSGQQVGYRADPPKIWIDGDTIRWASSGRNPISITVTWGEY